MSIKAIPQDTRPLILVLAAAVPSMGIGLNGTLPWHLSKELKYFRQVTTTTPEPVNIPTKPSESQDVTGGIVIMGRRTWESIPPKFRPLANRINIVLSSKLAESNRLIEVKPVDVNGSTKKKAPVFFCDSLHAALDLISEKWPQVPENGDPKRIFIIGGAQLYKTTLDHPRTKHVLLTEVEGLVEDPDKEIECDTFLDSFPWYDYHGGQLDMNKKWIRQDYSALRKFLHSSVELLDPKVDHCSKESGQIIENGYKYRFTLWTFQD